MTQVLPTESVQSAARLFNRMMLLVETLKIAASKPQVSLALTVYSNGGSAVAVGSGVDVFVAVGVRVIVGVKVTVTVGVGSTMRSLPLNTR